MQPDDSTTSLAKGNPSYTFEGYYIPALFVFSQKHGQLTIVNNEIRMVDDSGSELFAIAKQNVISIRDDLSQILIITASKKYKVIFRDAVKGLAQVSVLGPLLGTGGKNGIFAAGPQEYGKQVIQALIQLGYPAKLNTHRPR